MATKTTIPETPEADEVPTYVPTPLNACGEAAHRLGVVIGMLFDHNCVAVEDHGGYDVSMAAEMLQGIRTTLRDSYDKATRPEVK